MAKLFPLTHRCVTKLKLLILLGLADSVCLQRQYQNTHKGSAMVNVWYKRKSCLCNWICLFHPFLLLCQEPTLLRIRYGCCALIYPQSPLLHRRHTLHVYVDAITYFILPLLTIRLFRDKDSLCSPEWVWQLQCETDEPWFPKGWHCTHSTRCLTFHLCCT